MSRLLPLLESGKALTGGVVAAVVGVMVATFAANPTLQSIGVIVAALAVGYVLVFQIRWSRRTYSLTNSRVRDLDRRIGSSNQQLQGAIISQLREAVTAPLEDAITSISYDLKEMRPVGSNSTSSESENLRPRWTTILDKTRGAATSSFAPSLIPASEIKDRPQAHLPGRLAAGIVTSGDSDLKLRALMNTEVLETTRVISAVTGTRILGLLRGLGEVKLLQPGYSGDMVAEDSSYLIIDEYAFESGPWAGGLSTQRTDLFLELLKTILEARKKGMVIVVVASEVPQHFTATLRKYADAIVGDDGTSAAHVQANLLPLCTHLDAALTSEEK